MSVSFILTIYNKQQFLPSVLDAVAAERAQSDGEIILVDDGSTDESLGICSDFAARAHAVTIKSQTNQGVAAATNAGAAMANCPDIRFVDADDLLIPGSTLRLSKALEDERADVAFGRLGLYAGPQNIPAPETEDVMAAPSELLADPLRRTLKSQAFVPSVTLIRKTAAERCFPLPASYRTSQDFILSLRLARFARIAEVACICARAPESAPGRLSGSMARMYSDSAKLIADEWEATRSHPWPSAHRRYAVQRTALRALLYAKRHLDLSTTGFLRLSAIRLLASLPLGDFSPDTLRWIASVYGKALASPELYP